MENETMEGDGFYISYNPYLGCSGIFASLPSWQSNNGNIETALCKNGEYYILNGDFRKQYKKVINKGFKACMKVYKENKKEFNSSWTTK